MDMGGEKMDKDRGIQTDRETDMLRMLFTEIVSLKPMKPVYMIRKSDY